MGDHHSTSLPVVILAGGLGTRLGQESLLLPKPLVRIGKHPILLHIMATYIKYGHNNFIICAGYKADQIKNYFRDFSLNSSDPTYSISLETNSVVQTKSTLIHDSIGLASKEFQVEIVDTGLSSTTAERLMRISHLIKGDTFLCTYGDGVTSQNLNDVIGHHFKKNLMASLTAFHPPSRFGEIAVDENSRVTSFQEKPLSKSYVNGGVFVFNQEIFSLVDPNKSLEEGLLSKLAELKQLTAYKSEAFWQMMDTPREVELLNQMYSQGNAPWLSNSAM
jgi:glucose-1-phosphate cytidylyltransferase